MTLETVSIQHPSGAKASILPGLGFNCYQWQAPLDGAMRELLWFDPELLSGKAKPTRSGIPILFPFAGRMHGTELTFEGRNFDISDTLDDLGNPIHGFVLKRPWRIVEHLANRITGEFQASVDDASLQTKWPADYRIRISYQISADALRSEIEVHNPDARLLPFGLGTHAYFRLPLGKAGSTSECSLQVPARYNWQLDGQLLPTHQLKSTPLTEQLNSGLVVGDQQLDNLLTDLTFDEGVCTTSITDPTNDRQLTVRFGSEFANCVIFVPPHREALCVEPYTTAPDAFRLQTMGVDCAAAAIGPRQHLAIMGRDANSLMCQY